MENFKDTGILIIDDNAENLAVLHSMLDNFDFNIMMAQNGYDGLEILSKNKIELVLLDIKLPDIDGYEVCKKIRDNPETSGIPIIFISILSDTRDKLKGFYLGAVDYITKPFNEDEVLARIISHLTIKKQKEELKLLNNEKNKIFSIISHDLRGPLYSVYRISQFLYENSDTIDKNELKETLYQISNSTKNLYYLMENLLDWSIFKSGDFKLSITDIPPRQFIDQTIEQLKSGIEEKKIKIKNMVPDNLSIKYEPKFFSTIIRNIISNSIKHSNNDGIIEISAVIKDDLIFFTIKDNGTGIDENQIKILFDNSSQFIYNRSNKEGRGVGLKLCKEIIENYGGSMFIDSVKNTQTAITFTIKFPE